MGNRGLGLNTKCVLIIPPTLYRAEAWGIRRAERRKVNVLDMKC